MNPLVRNIIYYFLIILLQAILQGHVDFGPMVHFCLLPIVIGALPQTWKSWSAMAAAFAIGILTDLLAGGVTGINAAACVLLAALRPMIGNTDSNALKNTALRTLVYVTAFVLLDSFSFRPILFNVCKILVSWAVTFAATLVLSHTAPSQK